MIVGIGHVARVGKDTAAEALCRDLQFVRLGFADQLKELAMVADPLITSATRTINTHIGHGRLKWTVEGVGGWGPAKDMYPEVRAFLQRLGEGARKVFGEDFWIDRLMERAQWHDNVVIPDVRYRNEAEKIREQGGVLIRINRPGRVASGHVSETELVDFDWDQEFDNSGSVMDLQQNVVTFVKSKLQLRKALSEPVNGAARALTINDLEATLEKVYSEEPK